MAKKAARKRARQTAKKTGSRPNVRQTTTIAREVNTPPPGDGHDLLCKGLRLIYEEGTETRDNQRNSTKVRRAAHIRATVALRDARRWKCAWAERM